MPIVSTTVEASTTEEVTLKPYVAKKLLTELKAYQEIVEQIKALEAAKDTHKATIGKIRESTGHTSIAIEGYKVTEVRGVSSKLDQKKLIAQGVTMAMIEAATVTSPKKPYEKISCPGEGE